MTGDDEVESPAVPTPWEHAPVADERHDTPGDAPAAVALVLGAGGPTAHAWLAGALDGLAVGTGWDPRTADLVVGTGAGADLAVGLRRGRSTGALRTEATVGDAVTPATAGPATSRRPADPALALRAALRRPPRVGQVLEGLRPTPTVTPVEHVPRHATTDADHLADAPWPEGLWVCTVRLPDGRRVVFGRDDHPGAATRTAVQAGCSGRFSHVPVHIGARRYVEGTTWSATNADLVAGLAYDVVVVVVPATTAWWQRRQLRHEVARVQRADAPVLVLEQATGGHDDPTAVADAAAASVAARLRAEPAWARRLRIPTNR